MGGIDHRLVSTRITGEGVGSAVGLFLTMAQSVKALGVAAIGDVWLSEEPTLATYVGALSAALAYAAT
jgi:hypothetical protein